MIKKNGNEKINVIDRLYKKEIIKIKEKKKENIEKELNKKKDIIDWDKINYENNMKYTDNIFNNEKDLKIFEEKENLLKEKEEKISNEKKEKRKFEDNSHLKEDYNDNLLYDNYIEKKDEENNLKDSENNNDHQFLDIQSLSSDILNSLNGNGSLKGSLREINHKKEIKQDDLNIFNLDNYQSNSIKELLKNENNNN
jgi:hypothetical protein